MSNSITWSSGNNIGAYNKDADVSYIINDKIEKYFSQLQTANKNTYYDIRFKPASKAITIYKNGVIFSNPIENELLFKGAQGCWNWDSKGNIVIEGIDPNDALFTILGIADENHYSADERVCMIHAPWYVNVEQENNSDKTIHFYIGWAEDSIVNKKLVIMNECIRPDDSIQHFMAHAKYPATYLNSGANKYQLFSAAIGTASDKLLYNPGRTWMEEYSNNYNRKRQIDKFLQTYTNKYARTTQHFELFFYQLCFLLAGMDTRLASDTSSLFGIEFLPDYQEVIENIYARGEGYSSDKSFTLYLTHEKTDFKLDKVSNLYNRNNPLSADQVHEHVSHANDSKIIKMQFDPLLHYLLPFEDTNSTATNYYSFGKIQNESYISTSTSSNEYYSDLLMQHPYHYFIGLPIDESIFGCNVEYTINSDTPCVTRLSPNGAYGRTNASTKPIILTAN